MMVKFGEDKTSEGFLGAIGLGKKSQYTIKWVHFWLRNMF